ncbi:MAG: DUF952 domain-containing protein [Pseudomonadota bacterium]|nr:DUF952 domain-containing protein [Pseudomonadota bacterium]
MTARPMTAYKVLTAGQIEQLERDGRFAGSPADLADGFIHLSTEAQLPGTLNKHYTGQTGLSIAAVDVGSFGDSLKWEAARGGDLFPHLYAPLLLETVTAYGPLKHDDSGKPRLPVAG